MRILIADDDPHIRLLFRRLFEGQPSWNVCGEAADGSDAVEKTMQLEPDVVVMDLAMPNMNGIQAAQEISKTLPDLPMLLVSVQQVSAQLAEAARRVGFWGAVTKSSGTEVVEGVAVIANHGTYFAVDETPSA